MSLVFSIFAVTNEIIIFGALITLFFHALDLKPKTQC